jgi:hypothetical protein
VNVPFSTRLPQKPAVQQAAREFTSKYGIAAKTVGETGRNRRRFCNSTTASIFHTANPAYRTRKRHVSTGNCNRRDSLRRIPRDT